MPFIPTTDANRKAMLEAIGVAKFEDLLTAIPEEVRLKKPLNLPAPLSEHEVTKLLKSMAQQNIHSGIYSCFLGGGAYDHFIPAAINTVISRPEFYTAYTPYQPEVSQGTLQSIYEYQSMIAELTGMDAANASMYDGASALGESALLSQAHTNREEILISKTVHPHYRKVVATYCHRSGITLKTVEMSEGTTCLESLKSLLSAKTAGVLVQHPNFFGNLEPVEEISGFVHQTGALFGLSVDPISLGILTPPGQYGADMATGEGQVLGNSMYFGGPYLGIFSVKQDLIRRMPGRLVGVTQDTKGRRGFVLTLQTREQHIRREKATSSICTNEQLCALAATVYMALMGKKGLPQVANLSIQKSHYLAQKISRVPGFKAYFKQPFFKEFVVKCPVAPKKIIQGLLKSKILAGIDLSRFDYGIKDGLLIAVTEKRSKEEMDAFVQALKAFAK